MTQARQLEEVMMTSPDSRRTSPRIAVAPTRGAGRLGIEESRVGDRDGIRRDRQQPEVSRFGSVASGHASGRCGKPSSSRPHRPQDHRSAGGHDFSDEV